MTSHTTPATMSGNPTSSTTGTTPDTPGAVSIRRANPSDAGHRFHRRLGATLRTKMVAAWRSRAYATHVRASHLRGRLR